MPFVEEMQALMEAPPPRVRTILHTMKERNLALMNDGLPEMPQDLTIFAGKEREPIKCHKFYLALSSQIFTNLFQKGIGETEELELKDYHPQALRNIIYYAYIWELNISSVGDAINTAKLAMWSQLPEVVDYCSRFLLNNVRVENVIEVYEAAVLLKMEQAKKKAYEYIKRRFVEVSQSKNFHLISKENLLTFLKLDDLNVQSEDNLCFSLIKWGEKQCQKSYTEINAENIRSELGDLLYCIRFPNLTLSEFAGLVGDMTSKNRKILSENEVTELFLYLSAKKNTQQLKFPHKPRESPNVRTVFFLDNFDNGGHSVPVSHDMKDSFQVNSSSHRVTLKGIGFAGGKDQLNEKVTVEMKMFQFNEMTDQDDEIAKSISMGTATAGKPFYLSFEEAISIKPNKKYTISYKPLEGCKLFKWENSRSEYILAASDGKQVKINYQPQTSSISSLKFELEALTGQEEDDEDLC